VLGLLRERGESSADELAKGLGDGYSAGSVSTILGWARKSGLVESRRVVVNRGYRQLWLIAGAVQVLATEP
jgi:hypothetical protein